MYGPASETTSDGSSATFTPTGNLPFRIPTSAILVPGSSVTMNLETSNGGDDLLVGVTVAPRVSFSSGFGAFFSKVLAVGCRSLNSCTKVFHSSFCHHFLISVSGSSMVLISLSTLREYKQHPMSRYLKIGSWNSPTEYLHRLANYCCCWCVH